MTTYKESGVDTNKNTRLVQKIKDVTGISTSFSSITLVPDNVTSIVQSTDGVGTKIKLAHKLNDYSTIGQDLVAMCVNDIICSGAKPFYFQDYIGMNNLNEDIIISIIKSINDACISCDVRLTGGEMAEMPNTYKENIPELVGFATGYNFN